MVVHHNRGVQRNLSFRKESLVQDGSGEKQQNLGTRISMTLVIQNAKETSLSFSFNGSMRLFSGSVRHIDGGTNGREMTVSFDFGGRGTELPVRLTTTITPGEDELSSSQNVSPGVRGVENGGDAPSVHPDVGQSNVESISNQARTPQDGDETCHKFTCTSPAPKHEKPTEKPTLQSASLPSPAFNPFIVRNDEGQRIIYEHMQSISAMDAYRNCSFEEIRAKEYKNRQNAAESVAQKECPISPKETEPVTENGIAINAALHQPPSGDPISMSFSFGDSDQPDIRVPDPISNSSSRTLVEDEDKLSGSLFRLNINALDDGVTDRVSDVNDEDCAGRSPARDGSLNAGDHFDESHHITEASEGPQSDPTILLPQPVDQQRNAWLGPIGTAKAPFRPYYESPVHNPGVSERHQCISAMIEYRELFDRGVASAGLYSGQEDVRELHWGEIFDAWGVKCVWVSFVSTQRSCRICVLWYRSALRQSRTLYCLEIGVVPTTSSNRRNAKTVKSQRANAAKGGWSET
ncbi:hypothetical protein BD410DRAFT_796207 [Rickenella mellea]|uniref:Uncharacterized protein n=1 Tax=Rickenella mellea TaxID=50990 RepID=A0A4Y7PLC5_9AGAM|nr:hypothetical protein BD410DRAFT_796207 [Rickenella mellea]